MSLPSYRAFQTWRPGWHGWGWVWCGVGTKWCPRTCTRTAGAPSGQCPARPLCPGRRALFEPVVLWVVQCSSFSTYARSALSHCGPLLWNSLLSNLTSVTSLLSFRKALETLLFKQFVVERSWTVWISAR